MRETEDIWNEKSNLKIGKGGNGSLSYDHEAEIKFFFHKYMALPKKPT